jgi:hypothetical protein
MSVILSCFSHHACSPSESKFQALTLIVKPQVFTTEPEGFDPFPADSCTGQAGNVAGIRHGSGAY